MEICKSDIEKIIKYLEDAASLYDKTKGQRYVSRACCIRQLVTKLKRKLVLTFNNKKNEKE
ncbi:hypothetical protein [Prevotella amnii]|uniref:hypothetical protein n=1 Tax=Prevotella amnii TaxID=419005 RepID=UPI0002DD5277|nr:hypothetical protein [Prevotella amnii]